MTSREIGQAVLDPELEVRDGTLGVGRDKDIDVELTDSSGTCKPVVEAHSDVFPTHRVKWKIENNCGSDRKITVVFGYPEGSPLEPCNLVTTVRQGKQGKIDCKIRDDATRRKYRYDLVVAPALAAATE